MVIKIRIGCSPLTGRIYSGKVKNKKWVGEKPDVTDDVIRSAAEALLYTDTSFIFSIKNKDYIMRVTEYEKLKDDNTRI